MSEYRLRLVSPEGKAWAIEQRKITKAGKNEGKEYWDAIKYPGNWRQALETAVHMKLGNFETYDVEELLNAVDEAVEWLADELTTNNVFIVED